MKDFREKLKVTRTILVIAMGILLAFSTLFVLAEYGVIRLVPTAGDSHWQSLWRGFACGASVGIAACILVGLIRISKALRDEKKLKKLYVEETDERKHQIDTAAKALALQIFLTFGAVIGIVFGYFNVTVSITILSSVVALSVLVVLCRLYYSRKY